MGTYDLNPTAMRGSSPWVATGGTQVAVVSDSNDATYVTSVERQHFIVSLYSATRLPFGARVKYVQAKMRAAKTVTAVRRQKMALGGAVGTVPTADRGLRHATFTLFFTLQQYNGYQERVWYDGTEITQEKLDTLLWVAGWLDQQADIRVQKMWATVSYDEKPVVSNVSPTGTISNTTSPTVSWTYTDDIEPQESFEVEILNSGGDIVHKSGTIASASTYYEIPIGLPAGTYTARVRAAQKWDAWRVSGKFWSDWQTSSFTMGVQLPAPPSLVALGQDINGRIKLDYLHNLNLVPFDAAHHENEAVAAYATGTNTTLAPTAAPAHSGGRSMSATMGASTPREVQLTGLLSIPATEGLAYRASAWVSRHTSATNATMQMRVRFYNDTMTSIDSGSGSSIAESGTGWVEVHHTRTAPANTAYVRAELVFSSGVSSTHVHYIDDVQIRVTDTDIPAPTLSGDASRGGLLYSTKNLIPYADATVDTVGNLAASNANTTLAISQTQKFHLGDTSSSFSLTRTGSTGSAGFVYGGTTGQYRAVVPGDKVIAVGYIFSGVARSANVGLSFYDASFAPLAAANTPATSSTTAWTRLRHTATAPANAVWVKFDGGVDSVAVGELHYVDLLSLAINNESWSPATVVIEPPLRTITGPFMVVQYSEDEGITWVDLRTLEPGQLDGQLVFYDYEPAHQKARRYRAYTWFTEDGILYRSDYSAETSDVILTLERLWLHHSSAPEDTAYNFRYDGAGRGEDFDHSETGLRMVGRDYPIAEFGETFTRSYSAAVQLPDATSRAAWRALVEAQEIAVFRDARGRRARGVIKSPRLTDERYVDGQSATFNFELRGEQP